MTESTPRYQEIAFITHLRDSIAVFMVVSMMLIAFIVVGVLDYLDILEVPDLFYYLLGGIILLSYAGASIYAFMVGYQYWGYSRGAKLLLGGGVLGTILSIVSSVTVFYKDFLMQLIGNSYWGFLAVQLLMVNLTFTIMCTSLLWLRSYGVKSVYILVALSVIPGLNMIIIPIAGYALIDRALVELFEKMSEKVMEETKEEGGEESGTQG